MSLRKIGVEEELMLVDPDTCALTAVSQRAVRAHKHGHDQASVGVQLLPDEGPPVEEELFLQQIETATAPCKTLDELEREIRRGRESVGRAAEAAGAVAVAVATPVLFDQATKVTPKPRYEQIFTQFGEIARESLACAMHVHVDVADEAEAVAAINGVRPWLPTLLALSANSPFWRGSDTGYSSWRSEVWRRWPSTGTGHVEPPMTRERSGQWRRKTADELAPVREVFGAVVEHVRDALDEAGDTEMVTEAFERLISRGGGSVRQRATFEAKGDLTGVVADLSDRTLRSWRG